jgi:hypothetical protein
MRRRSRATLPTHGTPRSQRRASSAFLRDTLGSAFSMSSSRSSARSRKFGALVSDRDYEWYLDTA